MQKQIAAFETQIVEKMTASEEVEKETRRARRRDQFARLKTRRKPWRNLTPKCKAAKKELVKRRRKTRRGFRDAAHESGVGLQPHGPAEPRRHRRCRGRERFVLGVLYVAAPAADVWK